MCPFSCSVLRPFGSTERAKRHDASIDGRAQRVPSGQVQSLRDPKAAQCLVLAMGLLSGRSGCSGDTQPGAGTTSSGTHSFLVGEIPAMQCQGCSSGLLKYRQTQFVGTDFSPTGSCSLASGGSNVCFLCHNQDGGWVREFRQG